MGFLHEVFHMTRGEIYLLEWHCIYGRKESSLIYSSGVVSILIRLDSLVFWIGESIRKKTTTPSRKSANGVYYFHYCL